MTMPARIALVAAAVGCAVMAATAQSPAPTRESPGVERLIDELDRLVQARFLDTDQRFGMSRIAEPGDFHQTLRRFRPENREEVTAVRELDRAGVVVALYLAGRSLLSVSDDRMADTASWHRRAIAGPVLIGDESGASARGADLPQAHHVAAQARHAFAAFARTNTHLFEQAAWRFVARPVPASRSECLECHRGISTGSAPRTALLEGDTLGVVLYGYSVIPCRLCS